jgi:hypothetical protein
MMSSSSGNRRLNWVLVVSLAAVGILSLFNIGALDPISQQMLDQVAIGRQVGIPTVIVNGDGDDNNQHTGAGRDTTNSTTTRTSQHQQQQPQRQKHKFRRMDPSEPAYFTSDVGNSYQRFILVPEYQLAFCFIEKTGCMMFSELFRILRLLHPTMKHRPNEAKWLAETTWNRNQPSHFQWDREKLLEIVNNPNWTKAVFYRDPVARFASGFKSKCGRADPDGQEHCDGAFGKDQIADASVNSFQKALQILDTREAHVFGNPHFMPSTEFCGGLGSTIHKYQFIHALHPNTAPDLVQTMLLHVGVDPILAIKLKEYIVKKGGVSSVFVYMLLLSKMIILFVLTLLLFLESL